MDNQNIILHKKRMYLVKDLTITSCNMEEQISKYTYSGEKRPLDPIVETAKLPPFCKHFYEYIYNNNKVPTEKELFSTYIMKNPEVCKKYNKESLYSRILRAYPSFIRDFHFYLLLTESNKFDEVKYSYDIDVKQGIDIIITHGEVKFGISLLVDTFRSNNHKDIKNAMHREFYNTLHEIVIKMNFTDSAKCGEFYLYKNYHVCLVENKINKILSN